MPEKDIEQQIRMAHCGFVVTIEAFNAMGIFDKSYFFFGGKVNLSAITLKEIFSGK